MNNNIIPLILASNRHYEDTEKLMNSKIYQQTQASLKEILLALQKVEQSKSIETIVEAERFLLSAELTNSLMGSVQKDTLDKSLKEFNEGQSSLKDVYDKNIYLRITGSYTTKTKDPNGLPIDGFRQFLNSQKTRFKNKLTNPKSELEVEVFEQRKKNIFLAEKLYKDLQRGALDITKKQGLAR